MRAPRYVVISPVKDEERFIERTILSMRRQTILPCLWVVVDDGSEDRTFQILERHADEVEWIRILPLSNTGQRQPGAGVIHAFSIGYEQVREVECDFVVKLDCDLEFDADYFERLIQKFAQDPLLGIASGLYWEQRNGKWVPVRMPSYHAAGASKMIRRACFRDVRGFVASRGWDTVDEVRAQMAGWKTAHFEDLKLLHLKAEGSGIGFLRTSVMSGEIYYLTAGGPLFFAMKFFHRLLFGRPPLLGALAMLIGYVKPRLQGRPRLVNQAEARFYRALLNQRISATVFRIAAQLPLLRRQSSSN